MTLSVVIFNEGSPEQFLNHVQISLEIISQTGLDMDYQEACKADLKAEEKWTAATEAKENYQGTNENHPVMKSWKNATSAKTRTGEAVESIIQEIFMQYSTKLLETARHPWTIIIREAD